jgi:small subunit ribosomal protein S16
MSLRIRLARGGAKKRPFYRIVVADSRSPRDGRFIEKIGTYNPMVAKGHPDRIKLDEDRAKHWLSVGATPSDRVARFLGQANIIAMPAIPEQTKKNQPRAKTLERMKAAEEAKAAAAGAAKTATAEAAAAEAEVPAEEAPAEEPPAEAAPAEETAAEEAPAEAPAAQETPAEEAAPEETPATDEKPAEEGAAEDAEKKE